MPELPDSAPFDAGRAADRIALELVALRDAAERAFVPPPVARFRTVARRRTRRRAGTLAVAALALAGLGGGALAVAGRGPDRTPRPAPTGIASSPPAPSASAATTPSVTAPASTAASTRSAPDIRAVDWGHVTVVLPSNPEDPDCPAGRITTDGEWTVVGGKKFYSGGAALAFGDLTGDGSAEAVLSVSCTANSDLDSGDGSGQLLVVTWRDGTWTGLGYVGPLGQNYPAARVAGQRLTATIEQRYGSARQDRAYRWNGQRFVQVGGPTAFPTPS